MGLGEILHVWTSLKHCIVRPGSNVRLKKLDPDETFGTKRNDKALDKTLIRLREQ
jgi:hypothetical protein